MKDFIDLFNLKEWGAVALADVSIEDNFSSIDYTEGVIIDTIESIESQYKTFNVPLRIMGDDFIDLYKKKIKLKKDLNEIGLLKIKDDVYFQGKFTLSNNGKLTNQNLEFVTLVGVGYIVGEVKEEILTLDRPLKFFKTTLNNDGFHEIPLDIEISENLKKDSFYIYLIFLRINDRNYDMIEGSSIKEGEIVIERKPPILKNTQTLNSYPYLEKGENNIEVSLFKRELLPKPPIEGEVLINMKFNYKERF